MIGQISHPNSAGLGPRQTPRPGEVPMEFESLRVNRAKLAAAAVAVTAIAFVGGAYAAVSHISRPPTIEQIKGNTTDTKPEGYNPDQANPSGIPTSGAESE